MRTYGKMKGLKSKQQFQFLTSVVKGNEYKQCDPKIQLTTQMMLVSWQVIVHAANQLTNKSNVVALEFASIISYESICD